MTQVAAFGVRLVALGVDTVIPVAVWGRGRLRRAKTPAPERAIAEAKATVGTVKTGLQQTANDLAPRRKVQPPRDVVSTATAHLATPPPTPPAPPTPTPPTTPTATPPTMPPGAPAPTPRDMPPSDDEVR